MGNLLAKGILTGNIEYRFQTRAKQWFSCIVHHHSAFIIHHSSFCIHHSAFCIHHSAFIIPQSTFIILHS